MDAKIVVEHGDKKLCAIHRICGSESKALVIMAHGGPGGDKRGPLGLFDILAEKLDTELGLSSLRFDFLGYGESDGTPLDLTLRSRALELGSIVAWAVERGYNRLALVAESLGASVALRAERPEIDVLVFLWPAIVLADTDLKAYFTPERQAELANRGFILDGNVPVGAEFVRECRETDLVPALDRIRVPTLDRARRRRPVCSRGAGEDGAREDPRSEEARRRGRRWTQSRTLRRTRTRPRDRDGLDRAASPRRARAS